MTVDEIQHFYQDLPETRSTEGRAVANEFAVLVVWEWHNGIAPHSRRVNKRVVAIERGNHIIMKKA